MEPGEPIIGINPAEILARVLAGRKDPREDTPVKKIPYSKRWREAEKCEKQTLSNLGNVIFLEEDYKDCIKNICLLCDVSFTNSWDDYLVKGNICAECNKRIDDKMKKQAGG